MSSESEMLNTQKAAIYDLLRILKKSRKNESSVTEKEFSYEDLEALFEAYIAGKES